jgi:valyl-tRNA synthetase
MDLTDRWILSRLARTIKTVTETLEAYKFNEPINELYRFFWNDFCDWYLEWCKPRMQDRSTGVSPVNQKHGQDARDTAQKVLAFVLDQILRLLHPFVPFITEGIFQNLNSIAPRRGLNGLRELTSADSIMIAPWPEPLDPWMDESCEKQIELIQNVIRSIRDIRSQYNIAPSQSLTASLSAPASVSELLTAQSALIKQLAGLEDVHIAADLEKPANAAAAIVEEVRLYVHDVIDPQAERQRLQKQKEFIENGLRPLQAKLGNENFLTRAKPEVVEQTRRKLAELSEQLEAVSKHLAELER